MTTVLLYSGGLDSYSLAKIINPDVLLHVTMGTTYGQVENTNLRQPAGTTGQLVRAALDLSHWERSDKIIPGRNAHLVLLAANYGDKIILGATAGDRVTDKDQEFAYRINDLLQHIYKPQWWLPEGRTPTLHLPAKQWTKRELVMRYIAACGDPDDLVNNSISCYRARTHQETTTHCGNCKPCARKWVALTLNGVTPNYNASDYLRRTYVQQINGGTWDRGKAEAEEIMASLGLHYTSP